MRGYSIWARARDFFLLFTPEREHTYVIPRKP